MTATTFRVKKQRRTCAPLYCVGLTNIVCARVCFLRYILVCARKRVSAACLAVSPQDVWSYVKSSSSDLLEREVCAAYLKVGSRFILNSGRRVDAVHTMSRFGVGR